MTDSKDIKIAWFNFLKAFTRSLVQFNLNKPDHPNVRQLLEETHSLLGRILKDSPDGKFTLTLDDDKLLVNDFQLLTADTLPNSLKNMFVRFRMRSISFLAGVSENDIRLLCQMQLFKGDGLEYLKQNNVDKITFGLAADKPEPPKITAEAAPEVKPAEPGATNAMGRESAPAAVAAETAKKIDEAIAPQDLEAALNTIIAGATRDADEQKRVSGIVMKKIQAELETQVNKALTSARQEKEKLKNDMARTEAVISNIAEGVVTVDKDGTILMMNPQAEAISGKALSDLSGRKIFDIAQLENQVMSLAWELSSGGPKTSADRKEASEFSETVKKSTAIIQNEDGHIVGSLSIPTDTTKLREMEKLQQDFITNMTHELRSPLTSIKAALEILARVSKPDASGKKMIDTAIRNSDRLNAIITDILDFSKLQSGTMVFHQENVRPEEIAREAAEAMKAWANTKNISVTVKTAPRLTGIYADKRRTVQIFINLISNAIKFTPKGGDIAVSVENGGEEHSGFVFFSVKDNGCGIKKEDQARIFEKFIQVAMGEKIGGTGLGLPITKAMVLMQGGRITVGSELNKGSIFRVAMPVYKGQLDGPVFEQLPEIKGPKPWWKKLLSI